MTKALLIPSPFPCNNSHYPNPPPSLHSPPPSLTSHGQNSGIIYGFGSQGITPSHCALPSIPPSQCPNPLPNPLTSAVIILPPTMPYCSSVISRFVRRTSPRTRSPKRQQGGAEPLWRAWSWEPIARLISLMMVVGSVSRWKVVESRGCEPWTMIA